MCVRDRQTDRERETERERQRQRERKKERKKETYQGVGEECEKKGEQCKLT